MSSPRGLDDQFMADLKSGALLPILERAKRDHTLDFQIRSNEVHIYYRGGCIIRIQKRPNGTYLIDFDRNYIRDEDFRSEFDSYPKEVSEVSHASNWISKLPYLKQCMDFHFSEISEKNEREFQQLFIRENNYSNHANATDYFIIDTEYVHPYSSCGRADLIAFKWRSNHERKKGEVSLALIEVKYGDFAFDGASGIHSHLKNMYTLVNDAEALKTTESEMLTIFRQKRNLGLVRFGQIHNENEVTAIRSAETEVLLLLINHDPEKSKLKTVLDEIPEVERKLVKICTANFFGYGIYEDCVYSFADFQNRFPRQLFSRGDKPSVAKEIILSADITNE